MKKTKPVKAWAVAVEIGGTYYIDVPTIRELKRETAGLIKQPSFYIAGKIIPVLITPLTPKRKK